MGRWWKTSACDRAAQWISLELDAELSQLEQAALDRHRAGCASCRALSADVTSFTTLLREAPLVELQRPLAAEGRRHARNRVTRRAAVSLALAGAAAAAVLGFVLPVPGTSQAALAFQSVQQQKRFAHVETRRLEPAVFIVPQPPVQSFAARVLDD